MMKFVATVIVETEDEFKKRKPDIEMMNVLIKNRLNGEVDEKMFRCHVVLNIKNIEVCIKKIV